MSKWNKDPWWCTGCDDWVEGKFAFCPRCQPKFKGRRDNGKDPGYYETCKSCLVEFYSLGHHDHPMHKCGDEAQGKVYASADEMFDDLEGKVMPETGDARPIAYISGPLSMRGLPDDNYPYFRRVAERLREDGWEVLDPSRHFDGSHDKPFAEYMEQDIKDVMACDTVFLLPGWEDSEGARLEYLLAKALGRQFQIVDGASSVEPAEFEAAALTRSGARQSSYGHPAQDFERIAKHWSSVMGVEVNAGQVALGMVGLKLSRLKGNPHHRDSLVDAIGYLICFERILARDSE